MGTALIAVGLTGIWFLFLSRIRWKSRFQGLGLVVVLLLAFAFLFEYAGMSGDLVPQFRFSLPWNQPREWQRFSGRTAHL